MESRRSLKWGSDSGVWMAWAPNWKVDIYGPLFVFPGFIGRVGSRGEALSQLPLYKFV